VANLPPPDEHYVAFPVTPDERARLVAIAHANERDLAGEIRWRLRRLLKPTEKTPASEAAS
jgi:hypothetical protein